MKRKLFSNLLRGVFTLGFLFAFSASQSQIAAWNFESAFTFTSPAPSTGTGSASIVNPTPAEVITPGTVSGISSACFAAGTTAAWMLFPFNPGSVNESNGVQFNVSTVGKKDIIFSWDQRCSPTAANTYRVLYTTDGTTWVPFTMTNPGNTSICAGSINVNGCYEFDASDVARSISVDFTAITAANNNANFAVRVVASYYQSTGQFRQANAPGTPAGTGGATRFDNVIINGTTITAPTGFAISISPSPICSGDSANLTATFTGGYGPFTLTYTDSVLGAVVVNNYVSGTAIPVTPTNTRAYVFTSLQHAVGTASPGGILTSITVTALPTITASASATAVCFSAGAQNTTLAYTSFSGSPTPNRYSITWNASPANSFATVTNATLAAFPSTITIAVPAGTAAGTYTGYLTIKNNGAGTCTSLQKTFTVTVNPPTVIVTPPSASAQTFCSGESTPISVSATGASLAYQWRYDANSTPGGSSIAAGSTNSTSFTPTVTGYYFVRVSSASCTQLDSAYSGLITVVAGTVAGSVAGAQTVCAGETPGTNLVLSGNTGSVIKWERANDVGFTTGLADIGSTATTLTGADLVLLSGAITQTTFVRAYVRSGTCSILTTTPIQILVKSTTWTDTPMPMHWTNLAPDSSTTAIFDADYTSSGNLAACSAKVNAGKNVTFSSGDILTLQNGLITTGGTMTFEDKSSLIQVNSAAVNTGDIVYKRKTPTAISNFDYTYWSSPVEVQTLSNFSPFTLSDKYFWFDPIFYVWTAVPLAGNVNMTPGQGYIVRGPQFLAGAPNVWEGVFTGKPNNGDYTPQVSNTDSVVYTDSTHNLNCLGNPYPSAISADLLMSLNPTTLGTGSTIYFWTHNTPISGGNYIFNDFAIYNYTGGTGTIKAPSANTGGLNANIPNGKIGAGQGFVIKALATGAVTFTNAMRLGATNDNNQFYRTNQSQTLTNPEKHRLWLEFENGEGAYKQILIGYVQNASNGFENGYDGEPLEAGNPVSFYSLLDNKKLAIQGRSLPFDASDEVPLGFKTPTAGNYTIKLSDFDGMFSDESVAVYLEDKLLNIVHDLRQDKYSFTTEAGTFDTRFVLKYSTVLGTDNPTLDSNGIIVYKNKDQIIIRSENAIIKNVKVYDVSGRVLFEKVSVNTNETNIISGLVREVLLVQITTQNNQTVTKKIVN